MALAPIARRYVIFRDDVGRRWKVYDWNVIGGRRHKRNPGDQSAEYRGFVAETSGESRVYRFPTEDTPRLLSVQVLSQQLAEAEPGHPLAARRELAEPRRPGRIAPVRDLSRGHLGY